MGMFWGPFDLTPSLGKSTDLPHPSPQPPTETADSTLTLADFTDTTWLEMARASLLGNSDLVRLIGDSKVLSLLANADMAPRLPSDMPDPETLLESW